MQQGLISRVDYSHYSQTAFSNRLKAVLLLWHEMKYVNRKYVIGSEVYQTRIKGKSMLWSWIWISAPE